MAALGGDDFKDPDIGIAVNGDADKIKSTIGEVLQGFDLSLSDLPIAEKTGDGRYVVATSPDYADKLLKDGKLGDLEAYQKVIPEGDKSTGVFFVNFNSDLRELLGSLVKTMDGPNTQVDRNLEPLDALGISAWNDGDYAHSLIKVTTD